METYNGHVRTPADAILLFEACRIGLLPRVQRRLSEKERQQIKSGSVFVWDEREAGMRRWTDGKSWSASRVSGGFLTYREMEGKRGGNGFAPPVQAAKKPTKSPDGSKGGDSDEDGPDGYRYKPDGLMKQSFSITTQSGQHLHLISYYARSHPAASNLQQPTQDASLRHIRPPKNMYPESTVNETSSVPAVTRGPMGGSPYAHAPSPHQAAMGSPYSRPGPAPVGYIPAGNWPPTPTGTPPYQYAYYPAQGPPPPGHSPIHYGYPPHAYAQHPPGPTVFDRPPPPISTSALPPPPPTHVTGPPNGHPSYAAHPPQYMPNPSPRAVQATQLAPQPPHANGYSNGHQIDPRLSQPEHTQGPQLPALTGPASQQSTNKPPSPQPAEPRSQNSDSLTVPESNGPTNAPSPARTIPSVGSLLNSNPVENGLDGRSDQSNSRSGSKSPNSTARATRDIPGDRLDSHAADQKALRKLNSMMLIR